MRRSCTASHQAALQPAPAVVDEPPAGKKTHDRDQAVQRFSNPVGNLADVFSGRIRPARPHPDARRASRRGHRLVVGQHHHAQPIRVERDLRSNQPLHVRGRHTGASGRERSRRRSHSKRCVQRSLAAPTAPRGDRRVRSQTSTPRTGVRSAGHRRLVGMGQGAHPHPARRMAARDRARTAHPCDR